MGNEYIKRNIDSDLTDWIKSTDRMPLLLRGARQVGKSSSVRNLSCRFENFVEINFEKNKKARKAFEGDLIPQEICKNLSYLKRYCCRENITFLRRDTGMSCCY
jgi:predicted AAA+ superfamily ATPase